MPKNLSYTMIIFMKSWDSCKPRYNWIHDNFLILVQHVYNTCVDMTQNNTVPINQDSFFVKIAFYVTKTTSVGCNLNVSLTALRCPLIFFHSIIHVFELSFKFDNEVQSCNVPVKGWGQIVQFLTKWVMFIPDCEPSFFVLFPSICDHGQTARISTISTEYGRSWGSWNIQHVYDFFYIQHYINRCVKAPDYSTGVYSTNH